MIDYLERLERDLVEAIDRGPATRRRAPRLRLDLVAAAAAVAAAIALVIALGSGREDERAVTRPATPTVANPRPLPKGTQFRLVGAVKRVGPTAWSGPARGPGGGGTLTVTGEVDLSPRPCCDTPRSLGPGAGRVLQFRWTTASGVLAGCVVNTISRRPHARFVWDGVGVVTSATGRLARYRGRAIGIAGVTNIALTSRARIILSGGAPRGRC